ncbi:MAG: hypothetical protein GWN00_01450 [Aliifodinibius sp.]|nr:hypothetical protein [Fodinibius sp.]NIU12578.1 hypothetical protein [candidate division Zixibacteria bacterium]NIY23528.1 hypothetical protein [Fodinibius sp.]
MSIHDINNLLNPTNPASPLNPNNLNIVAQENDPVLDTMAILFLAVSAGVIGYLVYRSYKDGY